MSGDGEFSPVQLKVVPAEFARRRSIAFIFVAPAEALKAAAAEAGPKLGFCAVARRRLASDDPFTVGDLERELLANHVSREAPQAQVDSVHDSTYTMQHGVEGKFYSGTSMRSKSLVL